MELEQLPTEAEIQQYAEQKRENEQELEQINKKIADLETELAADDDEETLLRKIDELKQSNENHLKMFEELKTEPEKPQQASAETKMVSFSTINSYLTTLSLLFA